MRRVRYSKLDLYGRLGNALWEIAGTVGIAEQIGAVPLFPQRWSYRRWFSCPNEWFRPSTGRAAFEADKWDGLAYMDERARPYLQDVGLFRDVAESVRDAFRPSAAANRILLEEKYAEYVYDVTHGDGIVVHVRRGDLLTQEQGFQPALTVDAPGYYKAALHSIDNWIDRPVWVFSDDPDWCEENMGELLMLQPKIMRSTPPRPTGAAYRRAPAMDWVDLQLMALAHDHVLSNSTYAWWAAFLSGNQSARVPSLWFGPQLAHVDTSLMFEGLNWQEIPC